MAVDNLHLQKEWEEGKRGTEKIRKTGWRESRWADASDGVEEEDEDISSKEEELNEEEENEAKLKRDDEETSKEGSGDDAEKRLSWNQKGAKKEEAGNEENLEVNEDDDVSESNKKEVNKAQDFKKEEEDWGGEASSDLKSCRMDEEQIQGERKDHVQEADTDEEEHQEEDQYGRAHLREGLCGIQVENIQQSKENDSFLDSGNETCCQCVNKQDGESDELQSWTNNEEYPACMDTVSATQQDIHRNVLSSYDEGAQCLVDEDGDDDDAEEVKVYCKNDYHTSLFVALKELRDSSVLSDLTLNTEDGGCFHVHPPVLAAVSSLIRTNLKETKEENRKPFSCSVRLGPEVDHVGLEVIVEFAYTGLISVKKYSVETIKAAARMLGVPRVLDLCSWDVDSFRNQTQHDRTSATQQLMSSRQSIQQLWMDRVGCDVTLEALGGSLPVHRVILAASSDYFRGMFTSGMKESLQPCVKLPFLSASELEVLVGSSYSGALPLSWTCIFEITSAALQLQYQPALSLCLHFLQQELTPHTCLDVVSFAEAYQVAHLHEAAEDFVLRQFQKVSQTSKFKDLPAKQLLKYLNSNSLCVPSELVVFNAVVSWIQAKPLRRLKLARELMKTIYFPLMTFKDFKEVQSHNMWRDRSLEGLYEAILQDFCSGDTELQNHCRIYFPKECLVLTGGDQISEDLGGRSISRELWFGNTFRHFTGIKKTIEWKKLGEMPESARFGHEVAVLNRQLYVFGGKTYYGTGDTLKSVYRYDPQQNIWERLSEMQEKRSSFSVVVLDGKLYATGGHCEPDHTDSVECFCPITNSWSFTSCLALPLSGHVAKVWKEQIFLSGGQNSSYPCLTSTFRYHPDTGSTSLANMNQPRAHHCMETLRGCFYVAGGITTNDNMTVIDQLACEVYSPAADSWTAFASLPVPHVGAGSAVLEGNFYLLGGYSQEDYSDTNMVHRYDTNMQKWEIIGKMPGPNNDLRACLLYLPQNLRM